MPPSPSLCVLCGRNRHATTSVANDDLQLAMAMPPSYLIIVRGWPYRFLGMVHRAGYMFYLLVDTKENAKALHDLPVDGIITDRIDLVGPRFRDRAKPGHSAVAP